MESYAISPAQDHLEMAQVTIASIRTRGALIVIVDRAEAEFNRP